MSLLVKVSTSYAHLLLEAIATSFGTYPSTHYPTHPLRGCSSSGWLPNFRRSSTAIFEHDPRYLRRESWLSFPSLRIVICSLRITPPRPPSTPFIKFIILSTIDTVLMADRSLLAGGIPSWSNKLSLVFPFLSFWLHRAEGPHECLQHQPPCTPDACSRFPTQYLGFASREKCCLPHWCGNIPCLLRATALKLLSIWIPSRPLENQLNLGPPVYPGNRRALSNRGHLLAVLDNMTPVMSVLICCIVSPCRRIRWAKRPRSRLHLGPPSRSRHSLIIVHFNGPHPQHYQSTSRRLPRPSCS